MESRPPQDPPRRRPEGRKANGSGGPPAPPLLWIILIAVIALFLWMNNPKRETSVSYVPWFLQQVDADNIEVLTIQGNEAKGVLRKETAYTNSSGTETQVKMFSTYFPSDASVDAVLETLRGKKVGPNEPKRVPARIMVEPPAGPTGLMWASLLVPTFLIVGVIYIMMRRARDQFDGGILGNFVKSPAKRHDKSKQRTTFDEVAGLENAKSRTPGNRRIPQEPREISKRLGGKHPQGGSAQRASRHRQDPARAGSRGRGGRPLLLDLGLRVHPDVRRRRREPRPRHVQDGEGEQPLHPLRRRDRRRRPRPRARASAAVTTNASRRSTRSSPRWTASRRPRA